MRLIAALLLFAPLVARAQAPAPFEFRGLHFGDTVSAAIRAACVIRVDDWRPGPASRRRICWMRGDSIAGRKVDINYQIDVNYHLADAKLIALALEFDSRDFAPLVASLSATYGRPAVTSSVPYTSNGVRLQSAIATWPMADGQLDAKEHGAVPGKGSAEITETHFAAAVAAAQARPPVYLAFQVEKEAKAAPGSPQPAYPAMLRAARMSGDVVAQFVVDDSGRYEPGSIQVLKARHDLFTNAVRNVLPKMQFIPAEVGGRKVPQLMEQTFHFAQPDSVP